MTCSAATMTPEIAFNLPLVSLRSLTDTRQIPAVTNQASRKIQFRMTGELSIEIEFGPTESEPTWLVRLMEQSSRLLNLERNWNSYRSEPIHPDAVVGAINFLLTNDQEVPIPAPDLVPHLSGGVQLEWHLRNYDLEVLVFPDGQYRISYSREGEDAIEDVVTRDPHIAGVALQEIARSN